MNALQNGDLLLFEPGLGFEIKDLWSSYIQSSKYGRCGIVLIRDGICYCAYSISETENNSFDIRIEKLSIVFKEYQGHIWVRSIDYFDNFYIKFKEIINMLKYKNISNVLNYSSAFVCYIYSHAGILSFQNDWKKCLPCHLENNPKNQLILWMYKVGKETKLLWDMFV